VDILNKVSPRRFYELDSFLAFLSIYEDKERERAYLRLLRANRDPIRGAVCVEAGSGLGVMSAEMARLGAKKVYAVEVNPELYELSRRRLARFPNVEVVKADIRDFKPKERVDVLVHEFYGQLLYDEDLYALADLRFKPRLVLPDSGALMCGVSSLDDWDDDVIDDSVLERLDSAIVSGLFDEEGVKPGIEVLRWSAAEGIQGKRVVDLSGKAGNLLYFGIEVRHAGKAVCRSGVCDNWSFGWTWRKADRFSFGFGKPGGTRESARAPEALFRWLPGRGK
jgi:SAM-dependent methyltransferase